MTPLEVAKFNGKKVRVEIVSYKTIKGKLTKSKYGWQINNLKGFFPGDFISIKPDIPFPSNSAIIEEYE